MTSAANSHVLSRSVPYSGARISVRGLEEEIQGIRTRQDGQVGELQSLREKNGKLQSDLADEIQKLRRFSDMLSVNSAASFWTNFKEVLSYVPGLRSLGISRRSIEELLRQQYEISARRVKEASAFADKLRAAEAGLHEEIARLNGRIIETAKNEDLAAQHLLELESYRIELESRLAAAEGSSTEQREIQAELDKLKRAMSEHGAMLKLYGTGEERLARLKENTHRLLDTIANLASDIVQYVNAASEKLDLVAGQIQAVGTAADASVVMLEMKQSLDVMTESMNETTRFVSETQVFFRQNLDKLLDDLEVYDDTTRKVLDDNLRISQEIEEKRLAEAVRAALERQQAGSAHA